jgi:hypothetical protein
MYQFSLIYRIIFIIFISILVLSCYKNFYGPEGNYLAGKYTFILTISFITLTPIFFSRVVCLNNLIYSSFWPFKKLELNPNINYIQESLGMYKFVKLKSNSGNQIRFMFLGYSTNRINKYFSYLISNT